MPKPATLNLDSTSNVDPDTGEPVDLSIYQGDYYSFEYQMTDDDGVPIDLSLYTDPAAQIRQAPADSTVAAAFTVDIDPDQVANRGMVFFELIEAKTAALSPGAPGWDFQMTDPAGHVETWLRGVTEVIAQYTR